MNRWIDYHYHRPGKDTTVFHEEVLDERSDLIVTRLPEYHGARYTVHGRDILEPGAPIIWYLFPGEWYGIGRFHLADGTFTGWYTNLTEPVKLSGDRWDGTDLFLDHWTPADGSSPCWLDEDEYVDALARGLVDAVQAEAVEAVRRRVDLGSWPPGVVLHHFANI
ncbi:MAG: DUF402 domain-containing protein [Gemmatimonadales bacterium]